MTRLRISSEKISKIPRTICIIFRLSKMSMSSKRVYDICYRIQPLCKAFARTITAIRILTGISLREIISILSTYDEFEDVLRVIEREYMHSAFPQIIYNICEFELALSRVRTVLLIDDFQKKHASVIWLIQHCSIWRSRLTPMKE